MAQIYGDDSDRMRKVRDDGYEDMMKQARPTLKAMDDREAARKKRKGKVVRRGKNDNTGTATKSTGKKRALKR